MTPRSLAVLVALGVVAVAGGWYFGVATTPSEQQSVDAGKLVFPGLSARLDETAKIEIIHQGKPTTIERHGNVWGLVDRALYPVQETKLRGMLTALTDLRLVEPRTADPKEYSQLGVETPDSQDKAGSADLLRLLDSSGTSLAQLIVGHRRVLTQGNVPDQVYVRRPGHRQSWLAEGSLQVDYDPQQWLDRDIMNLDHARIVDVVSTRGDATIELAREGSKFTLKSPADHPKLDDYKLEDVSRALELLTFEDVHKSDDKAGPPVGHAVFTTADGMTITVTVFHPAAPAKPQPDGDKDIWVRFAVAGSPKMKAEVDRLEAKVDGWTYELGAWKENSLLPGIDSLKAPAPDKPAASAAAPSAGKP